MGPLGANGRVKGVVSTARRRVDAAWAAVQERRPRVRSVDATLSAYERDRDRAGFLLAGALAYRLFLWLLPFTLLIVSGLGFLESADHDNPSDLANHLGVVGLASKSVSEAAADAEHARFITLLIGIPALYFASLGAIKAFRAVSALAWGVPVRPIHRKPLAVLTCLGFIVAIFTVTLVAAAVRHESPGPGVIATVVAGIGYVWLAFLVLWILPGRPCLGPHSSRAQSSWASASRRSTSSTCTSSPTGSRPRPRRTAPSALRQRFCSRSSSSVASSSPV